MNTDSGCPAGKQLCTKGHRGLGGCKVQHDPPMHPHGIEVNSILCIRKSVAG